MKSSKTVIVSKLRNRILGVPFQKDGIEEMELNMKICKLLGLAEWAEKEMGERYDRIMDAAVLRYWEKLDEYMERQDCNIVEAAKKVPYTIPRPDPGKSHRKDILNYKHIEEIESLGKKIHDIKDSTRQDSYAFEQDMKDLGIIDKHSLHRYIAMKPLAIACEETCKKYGWSLKGRTLEKYIQIERKRVNRGLTMVEWWRSVLSFSPDPN